MSSRMSENSALDSHLGERIDKRNSVVKVVGEDFFFSHFYVGVISENGGAPLQLT